MPPTTATVFCYCGRNEGNMCVWEGLANSTVCVDYKVARFEGWTVSVSGYSYSKNKRVCELNIPSLWVETESNALLNFQSK